MDRTKSKENKDETSNEKFKRLSEKRVTNVLRSLKILGNLSNTSNYKYSTDEVEKIFKAIQSQVDNTHRKFEVGARNLDRKEFKW